MTYNMIKSPLNFKTSKITLFGSFFSKFFSSVILIDGNSQIEKCSFSNVLKSAILYETYNYTSSLIVSSSLSIEDSYFFKCKSSSSNGGAIYTKNRIDSLKVLRCYFLESISGIQGGAIYADSSEFVYDKCCSYLCRQGTSSGNCGSVIMAVNDGTKNVSFASINACPGYNNPAFGDTIVLNQGIEHLSNVNDSYCKMSRVAGVIIRSASQATIKYLLTYNQNGCSSHGFSIISSGVGDFSHINNVNSTNQIGAVYLFQSTVIVSHYILIGMGNAAASYDSGSPSYITFINSLFNMGSFVGGSPLKTLIDCSISASSIQAPKFSLYQTGSCHDSTILPTQIIIKTFIRDHYVLLYLLQFIIDY